jgi:hypothetical protein
MQNDPAYRAKVAARNRAHYEANREKIKARSAARRRTHAREIFFSEMLRRYGLTEPEWDAALIAQCGRCAICVEPMRDPCVDHCHATTNARGLLCSGCNRGLGHFKDDPRRLQAAAEYLS